MSTEKDVLSVREVAARLGISATTAYEAARTGRIPALWLGPRRVVVPRAAFDKMLAEGAKPSEAA